MKDELEKYIIDNKHAFDDYQLDEIDKLKLWTDIADTLEPETKVVPLWKKPLIKVAASIVFLLGLSMYSFLYNVETPQQGIVSQELYEIDNHYKALVQSQIELIQKSPNLSLADQEDLMLLIEDLDVEYSKLKKELEEGINDQRVIEAIISNYRKKIKIMENLLERLYPVNTTIDEGELIL